MGNVDSSRLRDAASPINGKMQKVTLTLFLTLSNKVEKCLCIRFVCLSVCLSVCPSVHALTLINILQIS